jgi:hypothetical protein|nr:MAG TPA: hypothetical protein [Caudoviricetes sp.]
MINKNQIYEFDPQIYPRKVWVAVGVPTKVLNDMFEESIEDMDETYDAIVISTRRINPDIKGGILIRFINKDALTISNITHESTHAAMDIFDYVGAKVDTNNQEPFSYLCGWIANCCYQVKSGKFDIKK